MNLFSAALDEAFRLDIRQRLTRERRLQIAGSVRQWLAATRMKAVPDLAKRLEAFGARIDALILHIDFDVRKGRMVLKPRGSDEDTLKYLRLGTRWFAGSDEVVDLILAMMVGSSGTFT